VQNVAVCYVTYCDIFVRYGWLFQRGNRTGYREVNCRFSGLDFQSVYFKDLTDYI